MSSDGQFPTRDNCNPADPEEAFLWMLVGLPGLKGAPLLLPIQHLRAVSRRLWDCGARPAEDPVIKYRPPRVGDPHWLVSPGTWTDINDPDPEDIFDIRQFVAELPLRQRQQLAAALGLTGSVPDEPPEPMLPVMTPVSGEATVSNESPEGFDPTRRGVKAVLAYLRRADPDERERVLAVERHFGKARPAILSRYQDA
ncbi:phage gene 29 protein family protein [Nocardia xishanensis]